MWLVDIVLDRDNVKVLSLQKVLLDSTDLDGEKSIDPIYVLEVELMNYWGKERDWGIFKKNFPWAIGILAFVLSN